MVLRRIFGGFTASTLAVASVLAAAHPLLGRQARGVNPGAPQDKAAAAPMEAYTETLPGTLVRFEMVPVPAGRVAVRTAPGVDTVAVGPFWMSRVEVTWDAYDVWVFGLDAGGQVATGKGADAVSRPSKPYVLPGAEFGHQGRPALAMTHHAATRFARWLSERTGRKYRLPTEAEWEYACRAGAAGPPAPLSDHAWYRENSDGRTHPGATRTPNAFGLYDLLGNVAEWVDGADGTPVVKGGSYADAADAVNCAARQSQSPAWNMTDPQLPKSRWWLADAPFVGFRLVREP
ncbi:MAG TPA: SUMF1/EgtB/PvdO family nonheme iron enzyme [Longimicrobiales bacterium]